MTVETSSQVQGDLEVAVLKLDKCLEESQDTSSPTEREDKMIQLKMLLLSLKRFARAKEVLKQLLLLQYKIYGKDKAHPMLVETLMDLGKAHKELGEVSTAIKVVSVSLEMLYQLHGRANSLHPAIEAALVFLKALGPRPLPWSETPTAVFVSQPPRQSVLSNQAALALQPTALMPPPLPHDELMAPAFRAYGRSLTDVCERLEVAFGDQGVIAQRIGKEFVWECRAFCNDALVLLDVRMYSVPTATIDGLGASSFGIDFEVRLRRSGGDRTDAVMLAYSIAKSAELM